MRIIAATQNKHKISEIDQITGSFGMHLVSMKDAGFDMEIDENGTTFEENSFIKASAVCKASGEPAVADDTGLCVDALNGEPGIYSARYAGGHDDIAGRRKVLEKLKGVPFEKRTAHFVCVITMVYPDGETLVCRGECHGHISEEERGTQGFGYDSIFIPDGKELTFAELGVEYKNTVSHRAKALLKLHEALCEKKAKDSHS